MEAVAGFLATFRTPSTTPSSKSPAAAFDTTRRKVFLVRRRLGRAPILVFPQIEEAEEENPT